MALALLKNGRRYAFVQTHGARALLAARLAGIPGSKLGYVFHESAQNQSLRGTLELSLARGLRLAANAPGTAGSVRARMAVPVEVVPPLVRAPELLPKHEAEQVLGLPGGELTIGVIGRLAAVKAPVLALEAAARLKRAPLRVVYVGEGPERERILARARELKVPVSLTGARPAADRLLAAFDVVACPSSAESFGLTMAQAAAAKRPVAIVDSPGARYVTGGQTSLLCAPTPEALAVALDTALRGSPDVLAFLHTHVLERFGSEEARERTRAFYTRQVTPPPQHGRQAS